MSKFGSIFPFMFRLPEYLIKVQEILNGKKTGHWIWYIFPQMKGLGKSGMSQTYAIQDRTHALEYMSHPILCSHYIMCCQAILDSGKSAYEIFGDDVVKVRSSLLLMNSIWNDKVGILCTRCRER